MKHFHVHFDSGLSVVVECANRDALVAALLPHWQKENGVSLFEPKAEEAMGVIHVSEVIKRQIVVTVYESVYHADEHDGERAPAEALRGAIHEYVRDSEAWLNIAVEETVLRLIE
ncbi:hypothetical protein [Xanthomonas phage JGB6]|nr:hypothetical protein [Xanthomonas phage JGB6]